MATVKKENVNSCCSVTKIEEERIITDEQGRRIQMKYKFIVLDEEKDLYVVTVEGDGDLAAECNVGDKIRGERAFGAICRGEVTPCTLRDVMADMQ